MKHFLGIDIAKDSFVVALLGEDGQILKSGTFTNDASGFAELVAWLPQPANTIAVCEPTGVYGKRLQQAICSVVESLHEINAAILTRFAFSQVQTKTDEADALMIAAAARTLHLTKPEVLQKSRVSCGEKRENLALWLNEYDRLRSEIARLRQQIECVTHHIAPDAAKVKRLREKELKYLLGQQKKVKQEVERAYQQLDDRQAQLIDSIPGVGTLTTAATLVVVRDVSRFKTADSLKAYLGIYPRRNQSGKREGRSHMAHHGNKLMWHMLWNAAKAAVLTHDPRNPFRALFDRLVAKGKSQSSAYGAVGRKLVQVIYGVLKSQKLFEYPQLAP
ncbi:MAG: IS110 family transposase [Planctomycetales bacterium]|nr:IS110 family transposase [Planctomycetales bacterium]